MGDLLVRQGFKRALFALQQSQHMPIGPSAAILPLRQHFLYFLPLPHGQRSFRPTFVPLCAWIL